MGKKMISEGKAKDFTLYQTWIETKNSRFVWNVWYIYIFTDIKRYGSLYFKSACIIRFICLSLSTCNITLLVLIPHHATAIQNLCHTKCMSDTIFMDEIPIIQIQCISFLLQLITLLWLSWLPIMQQFCRISTMPWAATYSLSSLQHWWIHNRLDIEIM